MDELFNRFNSAWATRNPDKVTGLFALARLDGGGGPLAELVTRDEFDLTLDPGVAQGRGDPRARIVARASAALIDKDHRFFPPQRLTAAD
ncbi:MAG: hypothetical protein LH465_04815 [Sphingomonas bacterium]|nr:hypothetical protein [Sphingomonas bacterium]